MFACIFFESHNCATAYVFYYSHFCTSTNYSQQEVSRKTYQLMLCILTLISIFNKLLDKLNSFMNGILISIKKDRITLVPNLKRYSRVIICMSCNALLVHND